MSEIHDAVSETIASYLRDPPDTDYQRGHLAAFLEMAGIVGLDDEDPAAFAAAQRLLSPATDDEAA
jgi:hypothetical protein